jgi:hypothetical protein
MAGVAVPMALKLTLRIDPALASSIFVTTFTDIMGFLVCFWGWPPISWRCWRENCECENVIAFDKAKRICAILSRQLGKRLAMRTAPSLTPLSQI